jgi:hypothetical protein
MTRIERIIKEKIKNQNSLLPACRQAGLFLNHFLKVGLSLLIFHNETAP